MPRRPVTTDMVARRLVHGALGVKAVKTAEQRQAERDLIKQAKGNFLLYHDKRTNNLICEYDRAKTSSTGECRKQTKGDSQCI